ncbi:LysR family transcriptional regulator [Microbacterium sp. NPDC077644]|uniref:LysR family transcriptional regulator n=1 Tax=Microbacterium sp. NPDC077644 TaxID=3155055 RepID=UPI00344C9276
MASLLLNEDSDTTRLAPGARRVQCRNCVSQYTSCMFRLRDLDSFLAIADTGSVSAASAELYLTQPTLSRRLVALEREVGAPLFRRTTQGMTLTTAGRRLEPLARDLVTRGRRAEDVMNEVVAHDRAFAVACPETSVDGLVAPFVARGGPITDIRPVTPDRVYEQLQNGADVAVTTAPPPEGLRSRHLVDVGVRCVVPPGHPFSGRDSIELRAIADSPLVMPGSGSAVSRHVMQVAMSAGLVLDTTLVSNGTLAQAHAAARKEPALVVEDLRFGLVATNVVHEGRPLLVQSYAGWDPSHYADSQIAHLVDEFGQFMRSQMRALDVWLPNADGKGSFKRDTFD